MPPEPADRTAAIPGGNEPQGVRAPDAVPLGEALRFWFRLGWIGFGGPAGQIALMHRELVQQRRWISQGRFLHALNYCMLLPGPEAQQLATYLGWLMHRSAGGVAAGALFVLPSLLILIALSWLYMAWGQLPLVQAAFQGIKPAVCAIVLQAAVRIGGRTLHGPTLWALAVASFVAVSWLVLPFPAVVAAAALVGALGGHWRLRGLSTGHNAAAHADPGGPALIDDHTPTPPHARRSAGALAAVALSGLLLWLLSMGLLAGTLGSGHTLTAMGWFFTKAALLTFGGAYAVLPYVHQGAVVQQGWLTPAQMMDGLALGETTPGPLIMVVAFVGFVGGYSRALFGPDALFLAGATAAALVTWFTFLPSFIFILVGGPLVERTRGMPRIAAPLTAITAAVVGVILSLALHFGREVLWPGGPGGRLDLQALLITLGAAFALMRLRAGVVPVIVACAVAGLLGYGLRQGLG